MASESFEQSRENLNNMTTQPLSGISELSSLEANMSIGDKFEGTLYHVLPSVSKVNIKFSIPVLFNNFIQLLEKEFVSPKWTVDNTFSVSSHIQGRKVTITVYESERTIEVSGPGHKLWKDIAFKRISTTLFARFLQNCGIDLQGSITNSVTNMTIPPQMASTPMISKPWLAPAQVLPTPEPASVNPGPTETQVSIPSGMFSTPLSSRPVQASVPVQPQSVPTASSMNQGPIESQMSSILEALAFHSSMINSLRDQLTTLSSELVRLREHVTKKDLNPEANEVHADTTSANVLQRTISVSSINSSASDHSTSTPQKSQEPPAVNVEQEGSKKIPWKTKIKPNKLPATNPQSRPRQRRQFQQSKILIIGDSIIKGINERGLKNNVLCHGISGGSVDNVVDQIQLYDLQNFSTIIVHVGGNDISDDRDPEVLEDKFDQLFVHIRNKNPDCKIIACTICPRGDCTVSDFNNLLSSLCKEHGIQVVQMEERFCNTDSYPVLRYYKSDHIHLSRSGVRRLLDAIEKTCKDVSLVDNYEHCAFGRVSAADKQTTQGQSSQSGSKRQDQHTEWRRQPQRNQRGYQQGNQRRNQRGNQRPNQPSGLSRNQNCMKCGESNHSTFDCRHKEQIKCYLCGFYGHKQLNCPNQ